MRCFFFLPAAAAAYRCCTAGVPRAQPPWALLLMRGRPNTGVVSAPQPYLCCLGALPSTRPRRVRWRPGRNPGVHGRGECRPPSPAARLGRLSTTVVLVAVVGG